MKKISSLFLFLSLSLVFFTWVRAEITTPYTVDEKDPVSFGDMTSVAGHSGLENYVAEYVNGYLHITFTYTHHVIASSSYPPKMYVTAEDPRATSTPTVKANAVLFQLLATTNPTDWYAYDVQFDATGYTVIVRQAGTVEIENTHTAVFSISNTDWAALANDYPLSPTTNFSMSFTPLLVHEASVTSTTGSTSHASDRPHREGEFGRCVQTVKGLYCPSEAVREREITRVREALVTLLRQLLSMLMMK